MFYGRNADNYAVKPHFRKTLLLTFILGAIAGQVRVGAGDSAQPIALIGWNADVVFENARAPTAASFDWPGPQQSDLPVRAWFEAGLEGHADGLPPSRRFSSAANTNVLFELQPYNTNNVLLLTMPRPSGTLLLTEPTAYRSLFILTAATGGNNGCTLQLGFREGTITRSSKQIPFQVPEWWASYPATGLTKTAAITGLARSNGKFKYEDWRKNPGDAGFALYQTEIDLTALNLHQKPIQSITFKMGGTSVTVGIFAISGERSKSSDSPGTELERK